MIRNSVDIAYVVDFLNSLLLVDRQAVSSLFDYSVPCNQEMTDHETVQVRVDGNRGRLRLIGLLNGMFGAHSVDFFGALAMNVDLETGIIESFSQIREAED